MPYIELLRPKQWVKNIFLFLPLFFDKGMGDMHKFLHVAIAFVSFSLMASAIYCFNDILDCENDRMHTKKKNRPVASGAISKGQAYVIMAICVIFAILVCLLLPQESILKVMSVILLYFLINLLYCLRLKKIAIVDVFCISFGFVLRLVAGGMSGDVELSRWILIMTFLIALFMAFAKRRDDVVMYNNTGVLTRKNVAKYNLPFMNMILAVIASMTMMCYIMYTMSESVMQIHGSESLYVTSVFVLAGLIRYLQISIVDERSGSPTELLYSDHFLQITIVLWLATFAAIIYF